MTEQKLVEPTDYFTISENEETTSCDFCNVSIEVEIPKIENHLVANHKDKFETIDHKFTCSICGDAYSIPLNEVWNNDPCANCETGEMKWNETIQFYGKKEFLSEWYDEEIISTSGSRQNSGSTRLLTVYDKLCKSKLFKLDYRIDYSYIGQSHCNLEYWNGKEFTHVVSLRMAEFVEVNDRAPDKFRQKQFEAKVHSIIKSFMRFV